jgi:site-specific DNA recombinase
VTLTAAIYSRKSTAQTGVADEDRSVTRQIAGARAFAAERGWSVLEDHVFSDDGVSGAEFAGRPGFVRLLNALKPRPRFQALIMSEASRLGREQIETAWAFKQLVQAGVRVFTFLDGRELVLDSPTDRLLMSVSTYADEMERVRAQQRTHETQRNRARRGLVTGGVVFGYDNHRAADGVTRVINEAEAAIVRRVFELCAEGAGVRRIAHLLNDERALAPVPRRAGRPRSWAPSTIREILHRPLYAGRVVWGRVKKRDTWGRRVWQERPRDDWTVVDVPDLRIVSEALWQAAHARLERARDLYLAATGGAAHGRPTGSTPSKYLLVGLAACARCGGGLIARSRDYGRVRRYSYVCGYWHNRGTSVCTNGLEAPMPVTNHAVLTAFEREILHPKVIQRTIQKALGALTQPDVALAEGRSALEARIRLLDLELARLAQAIASGRGALDTLVQAITEREGTREALRAELATLEPAPALAGLDAARITREVRTRLADWHGLLEKRTEEARAILRELLDGRLLFQPVTDCSPPAYEFTGHVSIGRIVAGLLPSSAVVTPAGFEPAISTLKGSRPGPG